MIRDDDLYYNSQGSVVDFQTMVFPACFCHSKHVWSDKIELENRSVESITDPWLYKEDGNQTYLVQESQSSGDLFYHHADGINSSGLWLAMSYPHPLDLNL